ncbi:MAG: hypothetical protein R3B44_03105 [Candidatus Brocadiaceae bacterium]
MVFKDGANLKDIPFIQFDFILTHFERVIEFAVLENYTEETQTHS